MKKYKALTITLALFAICSVCVHWRNALQINKLKEELKDETKLSHVLILKNNEQSLANDLLATAIMMCNRDIIELKQEIENVKKRINRRM